MSAGASDSVHFRNACVPSYGTDASLTKPDDTFAHGLNEKLSTSEVAAGVLASGWCSWRSKTIERAVTGSVPTLSQSNLTSVAARDVKVSRESREDRLCSLPGFPETHACNAGFGDALLKLGFCGVIDVDA